MAGLQETNAEEFHQVPRLTTMLRAYGPERHHPFDVHEQFVRRKALLEAFQKRATTRRSAVGASLLARTLIPQWDTAPHAAREVYEQFLGAARELLGGEPSSEELHQSATLIYESLASLELDARGQFSRTELAGKRADLISIFGTLTEGPVLSATAQLAVQLRDWSAKLRSAQPAPQDAETPTTSREFGSDLDFHAQPNERDGMNGASEADDWWEDDEDDVTSWGLASPPEEPLPNPGQVHGMLEPSLATGAPGPSRFQDAADEKAWMQPEARSPEGTSDSLTWLLRQCQAAAALGGGGAFSGDELALSVLRLLDSERGGDEVAGDLLDLMGNGGMEIIEELLQLRKEITGVARKALGSLKSVDEGGKAQQQHRMPSYGTQVSVHTDSERVLDKLRRKEEKRQARAGQGSKAEADWDWLAAAGGFAALVEASAGGNRLIDGLVGTGDEGLGSLGINGRALPVGTVRKSRKGYEEVSVPATPTAAMLPNERLIKIEEMDEVAQLAFEGYTTLNRIQSRIYRTAYLSNENLLVCAPTGAGKTNIAMIAVLHEVKAHLQYGVLQKKDFKIVYVAPMKALAAEMTRAFSHRLEPLGMVVKELTGDMQLTKRELDETQMIVTTPEKWDVITRKSSDVALAQLVKLLIIDEVHLLNDERGPVIETLVARTLRQVEATQSMIRIVGLSATLPNYKEVAHFLRVNLDTGLFYFDSSYRPIPLRQQYIGVTEQNYVARNTLMNTICYEKVLEAVKDGKQAMVFVHSRKDTVKSARILVELAAKRGDVSLFEPEAMEQAGLWKKEVAKSRAREVAELYESGFGTHHAGMLRSDRNLTEKLFSMGLLKVLVCTATLAWGVNLPAHMVVIKGTQLYDPKAGGFRELSMLDVMQIFGRAGRPQFDTSGEGVIITTHEKLAHYLRLMTHQLPIESQFIASLRDNLNAEVVLGTVTTIKEAITWLSYTYLSVRMRINPLQYGLTWEQVAADPVLASHKRELLTNAARDLNAAQMLRFDERTGNLYVAELGRVASHFYLQYTSVQTYNELLTKHMSDSELIYMVARSSEFSSIVVREEEQPELETLMRKTCPLHVRGGAEDKHGKISILIQAFISRARLESFSLVADSSYISQSIARVMRALFEICLKKSWCSMTFLLLQYAKAVERRLWPHQHPMRQFETVLAPEVLSKLEERVPDFDHLYFEMDEKEVADRIRNPHGAKLVMQCLKYFPHLHLDASVSPITRSVLRVTLRITPQFEWKDRLHGTVERWWIWVEDSENEHIYHSEYWLLTKKMLAEATHSLSFTIPIFEPLPPQYHIRVVSDTWLGAENVLEVSFKGLILPERHPPHTDLLDLRPLPLSALQNPEYEAMYRFTHFNPIQTQAFHTLYHGDSNVLLGAPTGSGKTISAELAMLRLFSAHPGRKVIYIAPLKALVRERMDDWKRNLVPSLGKTMVELTGDFTPDMRALLAADIIICTPEKWDGISRNWQSRSYVQRVGLMVIDEIHLLGADRGPILEVIVSRMRYVSSQTGTPIRFVGLSTALANARDLADWLGIHELGLFNFKPSVRPVPLEVHVQGYPGKFYCPRMMSMNKPTYAAINQYSPFKPVLVFVSSRRQTRLTALDLMQFAAADERPRQFISMSQEEVEAVVQQVQDGSLKHTLQFGIGLHHAGLNEKDRTLVEELFVNNKIQVLVCTSTLAWGVNFPAHLVVVKGTEYYDGKSKRYQDFPITDVLQMMGRAGRPQFDQHGVAVILVHEPKKSFYKKFMYEPFPVESSLPDVLHDHVNAEVVSGTIATLQDAVDYLTWTFFYRRLVMNPSYYGLAETSSAAINVYLSSLVSSTLRALQEAGCCRVEEDGRVEALMPGRIASLYYLHYATMTLFSHAIRAATTHQEVLSILCGASEYDELPVRHNEDKLNAELAAAVRWKVDPRSLDDPHTKANLLLQAHFSRLALPVTDYVTDTKSVLDQSIRVLQAMVDVAAHGGWLHTTLHVMHTLQMVLQAVWYDESPLLFLPHMTAEAVQLLAARGVTGLPQLMALAADRIRHWLRPLLPPPHLTDLMQAVSRLPRCSLRWSLRPARPGQDAASQQVEVQLTRRRVGPGRSGSGKGFRAFAPRFPKVKEEGWWLVVGTHETRELHALKRVSFGDRLLTRLTIPRLDPDAHQELRLHLVSDCYLGLDQEHVLHQNPGSEATESLLGRSGDADSTRREDRIDKQSARMFGTGEASKSQSRGAARGQFVSDRRSPERKAGHEEEAGEVFFDASEGHLAA